MRVSLRLPVALVPLLAALFAAPAAAQEAAPWCFSGFHPGEVSGTVFLPEGDLFCPLLADPKEEHSFVSYLRGDFPALRDGVDADPRLNMASVGLADVFPLVRFGAGSRGNGLQIGLAGAVFAQFDLDAPSYDLINADYLVGFPISFRSGSFSSRLHIYHQSSHLGDEFLLRTTLTRENLSFEAVDLVLSQEMGPARIYGGGEYIFNRDPSTLESSLVHGGAEVRVGSLRGVRLVSALDVKFTEQHDWDAGISARAGFEFALWRDEEHPPRLWGLMLEFYDGPSPYGQFFQEQVRWVGLGLHFSL
ncbi:MAG: DUF1207 domain-containing protein [Gemmatimonadetes bacterium]|nr:DUF1207 domain-containing protein [Gemmatimonadota bacterium]